MSGSTLYHSYARQLVDSGHAYYAFDTPAELERMRKDLKSDTNPTPQYNHLTRPRMRNSLSLPAEEVAQLLEGGTPYVIRIRMPEGETLTFRDMIRGEVSFDTSLVDDKVLLKADGMPTYHLAVVVDDYLMEITHAFRGEEWLPSAPVHILLWRYLGWADQMPQWAHLPLILKPDGHGKLSKRDGDRLGFPVFAMDWLDPKTGELTTGFRERGFLPEAFVNMLAMLGWNDGTGQELFTMNELVQRFSINRVHKGGAKFDYEKAKWFNNQYIQQLDAQSLLPLVRPFLADKGVEAADDYLVQVIGLVKERCTLLTDFWEQSHFFFTAPAQPDLDAIRPKWNEKLAGFFAALPDSWNSADEWIAAALEQEFTALVAQHGVKKGEVMLPLRIMLVGGKFGPGVFDIAALIGPEACRNRVSMALEGLS